MPRQPAWLAQQAAEKAIKTALIAETVAFPRTHNLVVLRNLIPSGWAIKHVDTNLAGIFEYAAEARYPGYEPEITYEDAVSAVQDARQMVEAVQVDLDGRLE